MGAYQVWVRVKRDQQKEKGDHQVYEWVHIKCGWGGGKRPAKKKKKKNYSTEYSHVVPHHSTDYAINCLTAQIGRDAVGLVVYGRSL
jgi:hypothetical protein